MRISTIAVLAVLGTLTAVPAAQATDNGSWCYRDFGARDANCSFSTARQCLAIAGIVGGVCERNHQVLPTPPQHKKPKRS